MNLKEGIAVDFPFKLKTSSTYSKKRFKSCSDQIKLVPNRAGKHNNLSDKNKIHCLAMIIIFENIYVYTHMYKQTRRSLSILFKELKYRRKLFTY